MSSQQRSVCVFCGARPGNDPAYMNAAKDLGMSLVKYNLRLVYGAGDIGIMGEVARATQDAGGTVFGVIPVHLMQAEVAKRDLNTFVITEDMHERKKVMVMNSDAFVVLPGGAGSLDEFFEILTWRQLGLHGKPIVLVNINGYWDPLIDLVRHIVDQGFAGEDVWQSINIATNVDEALEIITNA